MNQENIRNNTYIGSLNKNNENHYLHWEQQIYNYNELKDDITEKVTNHTNKLIYNIENKFRQINKIWKENKTKHYNQCLTDSKER